MFEAGKMYRVVTLDAGEHGPEQCQTMWTVAKVEGTLVHLHMPADTDSKFAEFAGPTPERNMILNTASACFHSATPVAD